MSSTPPIIRIRDHFSPRSTPVELQPFPSGFAYVIAIWRSHASRTLGGSSAVFLLRLLPQQRASRPYPNGRNKIAFYFQSQIPLSCSRLMILISSGFPLGWHTCNCFPLHLGHCQTRTQHLNMHLFLNYAYDCIIKTSFSPGPLPTAVHFLLSLEHGPPTGAMSERSWLYNIDETRRDKTRDDKSLYASRQ